MFSANNLAADLRDLGEVQAARDLDQDTLDRRRRVLGEDHPDTLTSAENLAADLRALGDADKTPEAVINPASNHAAALTGTQASRRLPPGPGHTPRNPVGLAAARSAV